MTDKVLVTGATGLIGLATVERFLDAGWDVVAVSRRQPKLPSGRSVTALSVDLRDKSATADALGSIDGITHIAYNAVYERPDLISGWSGDEYRQVNNAMLRNTVEPVLANADNFQHISIQQGTKYYGVHLHPIPIPARESDPRDAHENFFHDQEDYVAQMGAQRGFRYTALRPQLVTGSTPGTLNVLPAIGAYGAIRRELGEPFGFPGGPSFVWEAADADLVADVMVWSAESPNAANQAFNVTNGDVFEWRSVWPAIAAALGVHSACTRHPTRRSAWLSTYPTRARCGGVSPSATVCGTATCTPSPAMAISTPTSHSPTEPPQAHARSSAPSSCVKPATRRSSIPSRRSARP